MGTIAETELVAFAEELADAAGQVILKYWRQRGVAVESKKDVGRPVEESPVTIADRGAEEAMRALIVARYPGHAILGEELGPRGDAATAEYAWVLDPIDGTKSFITGKPLFGTLIALLYRGAPVVGIIDQCVLRERWVGTPRRTTLNGRAVSARGRGVSKLEDAMVYATTPEMFAPGFELRGWDALRARVKRALYGCDCYAYALCASGFVELVCEADLMPYDYLAVAPVLAGAGAVVTDWAGNPLTYTDRDLHGGRVLAAANVHLHTAALLVLNAKAPAAPPVSKPTAAFLAGLAVGASLAAALALRLRVR